MQSTALTRSLARAAVATATIATFGAQSALGFFDNKLVNLNAFSSAFGVSTTTSRARTTTNTTQLSGGPLSNQTANNFSNTSSNVFSQQNLSSGNVVLISQ